MSSRKEPVEGSEEGAVGWSALDAATKLALKDMDLVTEDDQFDVLVRVTTPTRCHERQNPAQPDVDKREDHLSMLTGSGA